MILFNFLIFPGLLFSAVIGLFAGWLDRKVSARLQWRIGPPWHQNFTDIIKLFFKETIVPAQAQATFLLSPYIGLLAAGLAAMLIGRSIIWPIESFSADLILVLYLFLIPAAAMIIGASSSRNPLASIGASREMKLVMAYELPFILSVVSVVIKCGGTLQIGQILNHQEIFGSNAASLSGALAFAAALLCAQAKLGLVPFDASEAEQEIMAGVLIEYSGWALALFKLTKAVMLYALPVFLISLFLGKDTSFLFMIVKFVLILTVAILIKNTFPRLRVDQAMRFFWGPVTLIASAAVVLAALGK